MQIINPATEEVLADIKEDSRDTLTAKFARLGASQPAWVALGLTERIRVIGRFRDLLESEQERLGAVPASRPLSPCPAIDGCRRHRPVVRSKSVSHRSDP